MSRYTRATYQEVAEILRSNYPYNPDHLPVWRGIRNDLESMFRLDNPSFNQSHFQYASLPAGRLEESNVS